MLQHILKLHTFSRPVFFSIKMLPLFDEAWNECVSTPEDLKEGWTLIARWAQQNKLKLSVFDDQHGQWWARSGDAAARSEAVPRGTKLLFFPKRLPDPASTSTSSTAHCVVEGLLCAK